MGKGCKGGCEELVVTRLLIQVLGTWMSWSETAIQPPPGVSTFSPLGPLPGPPPPLSSLGKVLVHPSLLRGLP